MNFLHLTNKIDFHMNEKTLQALFVCFVFFLFCGKDKDE